MIDTPSGVLAVLALVSAGFFLLEQRTRWKLWSFLPPIIFIYAVPVLLRNVGVLPAQSAAYDGLKTIGLPMFITLLLIGMDVGRAVKVVGRGVGVMLMGSAGVVAGGIISFFIVHRWLSPEAWKGFGALAGSWIGGTGNMTAVAGGLNTPPEMLGLAVLTDNVVYVVWLPVLIGSKAFADRFNRWARVPEDRLRRIDEAAADAAAARPASMRDYLYLLAIAFTVTWLGDLFAPMLPVLEPVLSTSTWNVLLVTTFAIGLSFTPARLIPGATELGTALVYIFMASMGARAALDDFSQAPAFILAGFIWIAVHGAFCVGAAYLFRVDLHSAAVASAANIGAAASAPVVAAAHRASLVPASILMALIGYAIGNYLAIATAQVCYWIAR